ncbi:MAG: tetratricopeptide repeat protein [Acidobacteria bacterium]|nr:tetratricopeptide repeat protein [Acidobacteriota bacterium]
MPKPQLQQNYTRDQVLRVAGVSERQLRIWERATLVSKREEYSLADLRALQTLSKMRDAGLGPKRIREVFAEIRNKLVRVEDPLTDLTVVLERGRVHVLVEGRRMEAVSGQLLLNFDQQEISRLLAFPTERQPDRDPAREKQRIAEAGQWFQRGLDLEQAGVAIEQAMEAYEKALALDPRCVGALVNLGTIHFHARQLKRAEGYYKRALEIEPDYALGHFNIANLYDERGDAGSAFLHYNNALRITPAYADAHYNLALLCQRTGQLMKAVRHWRAYLKLDPSSSWADVARRELGKLREATLIKSGHSQEGQHTTRVV